MASCRYRCVSLLTLQALVTVLLFVHQSGCVHAAVGGVVLLEVESAPDPLDTAYQTRVCSALDDAIRSIHTTAHDASSTPFAHFLDHGGHKLVYFVSSRRGKLVLKVPLPRDKGMNGVAAALTSDAVLQGLGAHVRRLFDASSPQSPLRQADTDGDGQLSDAELKALVEMGALAAAGDDSSPASDFEHQPPARTPRNLPSSDRRGKLSRETVWYSRLCSSLLSTANSHAAGTAALAASRLVPVVHAQCGNVTVVEFLQPMSSSLTNPSWHVRLRATLAILRYLLSLRLEAPRPLFACDMHLGNFGKDMQRRTKLVDVDALFTAREIEAERDASCIDDWQCDVKSSCKGRCHNRRCAQFPDGPGVNMHFFCRHALEGDVTRGEEDDNGVPMHAAPISSRVALGANALDGAPAHCVDELNGLLAQCRATGFATTPALQVEAWLTRLERVCPSM